MSTSLANLVARLTMDVPPRENIPNAVQYETCVVDAVQELGRRAPGILEATITTVAGQAAYALPTDCVRVISLTTLGGSDVLVTAGGLVPLSMGTTERWSMVGSQIVIRPTPQAATIRTLTYAAGYALGETQAYATLTAERASVAMLAAQAHALTLQANKAAADALRTGAEGEVNDRTRLAAELRAQAQSRRDDFEAAVRRLVGFVATGQ